MYIYCIACCFAGVNSFIFRKEIHFEVVNDENLLVWNLFDCVDKNLGEKIDWIFFLLHSNSEQKDYIDFISYDFSAVCFVDWDCFFNSMT